MGAKYDIYFNFRTQDRNVLDKAAQILGDIFNEKFTVEEYIHGKEKLKVEPGYLLLDEGNLDSLEIAAKHLSSIGVTGYIDVFLCPYEMNYIHLLGDGDYIFGKYVRSSTHKSQA